MQSEIESAIVKLFVDVDFELVILVLVLLTRIETFLTLELVKFNEFYVRLYGLNCSR